MSDNPIWRRYRDLLRPRPADDVSEEVRFHLDMREQEARRTGLSAEEARSAAQRRFGDVRDVVTELNTIDGARERRRERSEWLVDVRHDTRFALRALRRAPAFAAAAIVTVAVAIGANTTIFSFVNALLLEPLPYAHPEQLVAVNGGDIVHSIGETLALRERSTTLSDITLHRARTITLGDDHDAARLEGLSVTPNLLPMLGVAPAIGATFAPNASEPGNGDVILLSHDLWVSRYGADRAIVGRRVLVDGTPSTIIGVMPPDFRFATARAQFWTPMTIDRSNLAATWAVSGYNVIARLRRGASLERASAELGSVFPRMRHLNPLWDPGANYGKSVAARPLQESLAGGARPILFLLSGCVIVVLLVACVNVANLLLARATARERELAVRAALGGGRARLVRQLLTESLVLAVFAGVAGVALAAAGVRWVMAAMPAEIPHDANVRISGAVLAFTTVVTVLTALSFGLLPALRATSGNGRSDTARFTRGAARGVAHHRLSAGLVIGEVALAVLLVITAGLLVRSFERLRDLTPGFRTSQVVAARISPPPASYPDNARVAAFFDAVVVHVAALPGVLSAAVVNRLPIESTVYGSAIRVAGQFEDVASGHIPWVHHSQVVSPGYLPTMGIPVLRGRGFVDSDRLGAVPVAIVSASLARRLWPNEDPIGKRIGLPFPSPWIYIVGVVPDVKLDSLRDTASTAVYMPYAQGVTGSTGSQPEMTLVVRVAPSGPGGDAGVMGRAVASIVASLDRSVAVSDVRTMDDVLSRSVAKPRFIMLLVSGFALAALLLGAVGIYGVMSYLVSQRAQEMGIRVALGATSRDILSLVLGRGAGLALGGAGIGVLAALAAVRPMRSLLYGVSSSDPLTFISVPLAFLIVALAASLGPARRAVRADPVEALRSD